MSWATSAWTDAAPNFSSRFSPNVSRGRVSRSPPTKALSSWSKTFTDLRLCAAIVDRLTYNRHIVETGTSSYRLTHARKAKIKT